MEISDRIPSGPPPRKNPFDPAPRLRRWLGESVVFLKCSGKKPLGKWKQLTSADMTVSYLTSLTGHNIGVVLGDVSNGLCVIDFDEDGQIEPFLALNPTLSKTFRTRGARGCGLWIRLRGKCPGTFKLKTHSGNDLGEFRSNGSQSIAWGAHPKTKKQYQWLIQQPAVEVEFDSIRWPEEMKIPREKANVPSKGDVSNGRVTKGSDSEGSPLYNCLEVVGVCPGVGVFGSESEQHVAKTFETRIDETAKREIEEAIEIGERATRQNNSASLRACLALIQIRGVESLSDLPQVERRYLAERWYQHLKSKGRTTKPQTHYYNDIFNSIKNATRQGVMNEKNPLPFAWELAQRNPPPLEAKEFEGDEIMQRLIALCYQLDKVKAGGSWFVARSIAGKLLGLDATETRNLSENFRVLVGCGILEIVKPPNNKEKKATIYRYVPKSPRPAKEGDAV